MDLDCRMITNVLCTAPLTAVLVDTNKGVRPCCVFNTEYLGNLKDDSVVNILNSTEWKKIKEQMYNHEWPVGCLPCKEREEVTGWSVRKLFADGTFDVVGWETEKITYLEFNGSNTCNLACLHCTPGFSSRWVIDNVKANKVWKTYDKPLQDRLKWMDAIAVTSNDSNSRATKMHLPDPDLILKNLQELDLTHIRTINFKGGEPFLNKETSIILEYLLEKNILQNVTVVVSTNGTFITDRIIELLKECKKVNINVSVDGVGELFNYIRYGDAKFDDIEPTLAKLNTVPGINIEIQAAVMNYNAFNLIDIREWAFKMAEKYNHVRAFAGFANCVQAPQYLSLNTLSDETRKELYDFYKENTVNFQEFREVLTTLASNYSGDDMHNYWVDYTKLMEDVRGNNILAIVPQLEKELKYK